MRVEVNTWLGDVDSQPFIGEPPSGGSEQTAMQPALDLQVQGPVTENDILNFTNKASDDEIFKLWLVINRLRGGMNKILAITNSYEKYQASKPANYPAIKNQLVAKGIEVESALESLNSRTLDARLREALAARGIQLTWTDFRGLDKDDRMIFQTGSNRAIVKSPVRKSYEVDFTGSFGKDIDALKELGDFFETHQFSLAAVVLPIVYFVIFIIAALIPALIVAQGAADGLRNAGPAMVKVADRLAEGVETALIIVGVAVGVGIITGVIAILA